MQLWADAIIIAVLALVIDRCLGDPSNRYHPLRWMGNLLNAIDNRVKRRQSITAVLMGFLSYLFVLLLFGGVALTITGGVRILLGDLYPFTVAGIELSVGEILWLFVTAYLTKITFALFAFRRFCRPIEDDLNNGDLDAAAEKTQMMVNRKMAGMDLPHITSSCCETISENLVDSVISPLTYFGIFGLPGAIAFRCANLMDAMWGRLNEKYKDIGHFPARWDDVLGFIPSRLSPLFIGFAAWLMRIKNRNPATRAAIKEHTKTPSPNSGWPMTATAAAMGVSFEKEGVYVMGEGPLPTVEDIGRCYRLIEVTSVLFLLIITVPLITFAGIHVQIIFEDFIYRCIGVL
ncbi:MAG: cobalamin biosynthesis protein CobD [Candidatus Methanomethylophilus sp.]|nr:cobalamin biosynthesis protein CobD [Methanomethylophilus sp.]